MGLVSPADGDEMAWISEGDFVQYRAYTAEWEPQKTAIMQVKNVNEAFITGVHSGAEDAYLEWFLCSPGEEGAIGEKVRYHFCSCAAKDCQEVPSRGWHALHIDFHRQLQPEEAHGVLKEWGVAVFPPLPVHDDQDFDCAVGNGGKNKVKKNGKKRKAPAASSSAGPAKKSKTENCAFCAAVLPCRAPSFRFGFTPTGAYSVTVSHIATGPTHPSTSV
mgnify:CR=1 FL=1